MFIDMEDRNSDDEYIIMPLLTYPEDFNNKEENPCESPRDPPSKDPTPEPRPPREKPTKELTL